MVIIFLVLVFLNPLHSSAGELQIEQGSVDLLHSEALTKPWTVFDQLLYGLKNKVKEGVHELVPVDQDYRPSKGFPYVDTDVGYSKENQRVVVYFDMKVTSMNDPWRAVCQRHVNDMAILLGVRGLGSQTPDQYQMRGRGIYLFLEKYIGRKWSAENMPSGKVQPFVDSIVIIGKYLVEGGDPFAYLRACALHINNDHITYYEHKY